MSREHDDNNVGEMRVELKYCEACGGLWVRERGTGEVYCGNCAPRVDELPFQKKRPGRVRLPEGKPTVAEKYIVILDDDGTDLKGVGGASCTR